MTNCAICDSPVNPDGHCIAGHRQENFPHDMERHMQRSYFQDVKAFHRMFRSPPMQIRRLDANAWARRVRLVNEEWSECTTAYALEDESKFADSLVDLTWVVLGTAVEAGLPFDELWREVRRANMDKRAGTLDANGKLLKPLGWKPPDIDAILRKKFDNETAGEGPNHESP